MPSEFFTLILGLVLGVKHAFEPDHLLAISTIVKDHKNPFKASLVGVFWGLGHTATLFITGVIILLLKLSVPEDLSLTLEILVGFMLIILGLRALSKKPTERKHQTSFLIGGVHGLAGTGALMLLVLTTVSSFLEGLSYILLFGLGSILGMTAVSFLVALPFIFSASRFPQIEKYLGLFAGVLSILFGLFIIYRFWSILNTSSSY